MQLTVFGATGRTGIRLVRQALDRGHRVIAFVRPPKGITADDPALTVVEGDVYTGVGVADAVRDADAVVSVLGQTSGGPDNLLAVAGDNITTAMHEAGLTRYVTLVGAGVREEGETVPLSGRVMGTVLKLLAGEVLADAEAHVERVRSTGFEWTIVRAPRLSDSEGTGRYRAGDIALGFESIARADVARFILDTIEDEQHIQKMPKVGSA